MKGRAEWRSAIVTATVTIAEGVRMIELAVDGALPPFEPGSHLEVEVQIAGRPAIRSYTCLPAPAGRVRVAVRRHENSRGGSRFMWQLIEGAPVRVTVPVNRFELSWRAPHYLLVAGGIGITPIYGMARALSDRGASLRLVHGARTRRQMAFAADLADRLGDTAEFFAGDEGRRIDLAAEIASLPGDAEIYVCGPVAMLEAARVAWNAAGRPPGRFRCEVFGDSGLLPETDFRVEVAGHGLSVDVRPDQTLLDALIEAGVDMIHDCRRGECGLCVVDIVSLDGTIDHRDVFFSAEEKAHADRMCACVSRIVDGRAVVDVGYRPAGASFAGESSSV
jgi:ferredoxin-NADP reductase